jgi:dethiobiotin synthetase
LAYFGESVDELATINPVRYRPELAPAVAAERSRRPVDGEAISEAYRRIRGHSDVVLVEGIGGLLVPLGEKFCVADLAGQLGLPLVIVARAGLGTINHTLLTIEAARGRGLAIAAVVLNRYSADSASLAEETNPEAIARYGGVPLPVVVPEDKHTSVADVRLGGDVIEALGQLVWPEAIAKLWRRGRRR